MRETRSTGLLQRAAVLLVLGACASTRPAPPSTSARPASPALATGAAHPDPSGVERPPHEASPSSFRELLEELRSSSPQLAAAHSRAAARRAEIDTRRSARRGEITPFAQAFQYDSDRLVNPISDPSGITPSLFSDQQYGVGLEGRLALDISGRIGEDTRSAEARALAFEQQAAALELELDQQASSLYRGLQALEGTRAALEAQRDALARHVELARSSVAVGRLEAVEILRLQAAHDAVVGQLAALDAREAGLRSGLAALLHQPGFSSLVPPPDAEPGPPEGLPGDVASHPAIRASNSSAESAAHEAQAARAARRPNLDLVGGVGWNDGLDADGDTTAQIGLRLSWPAYDGGRRSSQQRTAHHEERAARQELAGVIDRVNAGVAASSAAWQSAEAALRAARSGYTAAAEAARVQRSRFEADRLSSTDLLDAEARLAEAAEALSSALVGWWRADDALYIAHGLTPRGETATSPEPTDQP